MLIGKQFGRYEIRSKLGSGGMGEVYVGYDDELKRNVAIKILPAEFSSDETRKSRFRQEARATSALNHPNIITIYEIGENEHGAYLVTELIDGNTLRETIKSESLTFIKILKIVEQIAKALVAAHAAHIVHRDIKPENVMIRHDGIVKVLDFGLAKPTLQETGTQSDEEAVKTIPGMVMGSARYMSPEQARGKPVDERTDIWSLGVVLYEMLTGKTPFKGETNNDTIAAVIHQEPVPLANLIPQAPGELHRIIRKALQKDPDERYQNVKDLALDLKDLIYELEHENSTGKIHSSSADINLSENPTIIHQTASANHSTGTKVFSTSDTTQSETAQSDRQIPKRKWQIGLAALGLLAVLSALLLGFYKWSNTKTQLAKTAFAKTQVSLLPTDGKVAGPAISSDGKYIAYINGEVGNRSVCVRQISTDSVVTIVPPTPLNTFGLSFSPGNDYVYYLQSSEDSTINTLYRIPTLGGTPKKLIEDVDSPVTFSPDGKQLAFHRNVSKDAIVIIFTANADGTNLQPLIRSDETEFNIISNPEWSPDGSTILVRALNNFGGTVQHNDIAEVSLAEKKLKVFGKRKWTAAIFLSWFNDGSGFLFIGQETPNSPAQIWRASYPAGEFSPVTNDINNYSSLGVSDDGKTLVTLKSNATSSIWNYDPVSKKSNQITVESQNQEGRLSLAQMPNGKIVHSRRNGNEESLWIMNAAEANSGRQLSTEIKTVFNNPTITPDGRYIVFSSNNSGSPRIWRMDSDGKNPVQLTEGKTNYGNFNPQIMPDGKTVLYHEYASGANGETALMKVSIDGGESSVFFDDRQYNIYNHTISPDGKYIAYFSFNRALLDKGTGPPKTIRIAKVENNSLGETVRDLSADAVNSFIWSPDSKSLTLSSNRNGVPNLWRLPVDGSPAQLVTDFKSGRISNFTWSADGKTLLIVRAIVNNDLILIRDSGTAAN